MNMYEYANCKLLHEISSCHFRSSPSSLCLIISTRQLQGLDICISTQATDIKCYKRKLGQSTVKKKKHTYAYTPYTPHTEFNRNLYVYRSILQEYVHHSSNLNWGCWGHVPSPFAMPSIV